MFNQSNQILKRIYKEKTIGDDAEKLANFEENFGWPLSAEEQLDKLKNFNLNRMVEVIDELQRDVARLQKKLDNKE